MSTSQGLQDASNLDDKIDVIRPNKYYDDEELCDKHQEIRGSYYSNHYGYCVYCILDGQYQKWHEQWDSWGEVSVCLI